MRYRQPESLVNLSVPLPPVVLTLTLLTGLLDFGLACCAVNSREARQTAGADPIGLSSSKQIGPPLTPGGIGAQAANYDVAADFSGVVGQVPSACGTNVWWTDQDPGLWTERWSEMGPTQFRLPVIHALIEPQNDNNDPTNINWSGFLFDVPLTIPGMETRTITHRIWFEAIRDQPDVEILIYLVYLAPWLTNNPALPQLPISAAPYPPSDLAEYREFVEAVLRYLVDVIGFSPERIAVEAMNEPDLGCGVDPVTACFWNNWAMADIVDVVRVTHQAIQAVNPDIRLIGLAECCGTDVVRELLDRYLEGSYLDGLSIHYYSPSGYKLDPALSRAKKLSPYRRPIYLDEYGSRQYLSDGVNGALWHSWALVTLAQTNIAPLQYPISEWPLLGEPYNSMGLFADWRGNWTRKPSYWVYANFFRLIGAGSVILHTAPEPVDILAIRHVAPDRNQAALWVVNREDEALDNLSFAVYNFPTWEATLQVYDNMLDLTPTLTSTVRGSPLTFVATLPAHSSHTFVLSGQQSPRPIDRLGPAPEEATCTGGETITHMLTARGIGADSWEVSRSGIYASSSGAGGRYLPLIQRDDLAH